jgi:hypothetical protein
LKDYVQRVVAAKESNPAVSTLPIKPENMPGYCQKRKTAAPTKPLSLSTAPSTDITAANNISAIYLANSHWHGGVLSNVPLSNLIALNLPWTSQPSTSLLHCTIMISSLQHVLSITLMGMLLLQ